MQSRRWLRDVAARRRCPESSRRGGSRAPPSHTTTRGQDSCWRGCCESENRTMGDEAPLVTRQGDPNTTDRDAHPDALDKSILDGEEATLDGEEATLDGEET